MQRPFVAAKPAGRPPLRPMAVCPVAKATKASELRSLSNEDIERQVEDGKKELFSLRIKYAKREVSGVAVGLQLLVHCLFGPPWQSQFCLPV